MYMWEWEKTPEGKEAMEQLKALRDHPPQPRRRDDPLRDMIHEAHDMVSALGHDAIKTRIGHIHHLTALSSLEGQASRLRQNIEDEISGHTNDLEACLVKQAQSLDSLYDFFVQLSQYALTEGVREIQIPFNLAFKAQSQCAGTIDKFRKLQERRLKNAERKEGIENKKKEKSRN